MEDPPSHSTGRELSAPPRWYVSFDPATKSLAWSLLRVWEPPSAFVAKVRRALGRRGHRRGGWLEGAGRRLKAAFHLVDGGTVDLAPGVSNGDLSKVQRIRALKAYIHGTVLPALARAEGCPGPADPALNVVVEFQMGPNAPSRAVAHAILYEFAGARVFEVDPAHKNRLRFAARRDLDYCHFMERCWKPYTANKNHSAAVYAEHIAPLFDHPSLPGVRREHRKDFADTVTQVLGWLRFGDRVAPEKRY